MFGLNEKNFAIAATVAISFLYLLEVNGLILAGSVTNAATTQIINPHIYSDLATLKGNFSTFTLPALPGAGTMPDLYPGMATYYQSVSHKAIVGGLDGRQNTTQLLSLYNMPLTIVAQELSLNLTPNYQSPVLQNYTNQTILAMENYNTAVLILEKQAFTPTTLSVLAGYLTGAFGNPIYSDNTTLAFSTSNAISKVFEKGYVAYPSLTNWQQASLLINGTTRTMWIPEYPASIIVYAPYLNQSLRVGGLYNGYQSSINTTIAFQAIATGSASQLVIAKLSQNGASLVQITSLNLSSNLENYKITTPLVSGPVGTTLFFLVKNSTTSAYSQGTVAMNNITFSYANK